MTIDIMKPLMDDLDSIIKGLIVKKQHQADLTETSLSRTTFDNYYMVARGIDTFDNYYKFSESSLKSAGLTTDQVEDAMRSKYNIPEEFREKVMVEERKKIRSEFQEKNNYYRKLNGLPDLGDFDLFIKGVNGIRDNVPVHELTNSEIFIAKSQGLIEKLKKENPDKEYLNFLGTDKIGLITARIANRWDILATGTYSNKNYYNIFMQKYKLSQDFILDTMYDPSRSTGEYENFIGYTILMNAYNMTISEMPNIIQDKLYNEDIIIDLVLKSHGYYDEFKNFPTNYKKKISDNIVKLIRNKGNDDIYNIVARDIFGMKDLDVYKLKIIKNHIRDESDNPIFPKKEDGTTPDLLNTYDIYFSKVKMDKNVSVVNEVRNIMNIVPYNITENDPYWGGTAEEKVAIKEILCSIDKNMFNSKYITMNNIYDLTEMNFELSYFINMVLSAKTNIEDILVYMGSTLSSQKLFNVFVFLFSAISRHIKFGGDIISDISAISTIKRFNVEYNVDTMNDILKKYHTHKVDLARINLNRLDVNLDSSSDLMNAFFENRDIYNYLNTLKGEAEDFDTVMVCSELLEYFFTSKQVADIYRMSNGQIADTYEEYLQSEAPELYAYLITYDQAQLQNLIDEIWRLLEDGVDGNNQLRYAFLNLPNNSGEAMFRYLLDIMNVFKDRVNTITGITSSYTLQDEDIKIVDKVIPSVNAPYKDEPVGTDTKLVVRYNGTIDESIGIYDVIIVDNINII